MAAGGVEERVAAQHRLDAVQAILDVAIEPLGLADLVDELLRRLTTTIRVDAAALFLCEGEGLVPYASRGMPAGYFDDRRIPFGRGITGRVAETRAPLVLDDVHDAEEVWTEHLGDHIRSLAAVPLVHADALVGVLAVATTQQRDLRDNVVLLELVGGWTAAVIARAQLEGERREQERRARLLADVSHALAAGGADLDAALRAASERITDTIGDGCSIHLLSADRRTLEAAALHKRDPEQLAIARQLTEHGIEPRGTFRDVIETGETKVVLELPPAQFEEHLRLAVTSLIAAPLIVRDEVIGLVAISRSGHGAPPYSEADRTLVEEVALRVSVAVDNARLFRKAHEAEERFRAMINSTRIGLVARDRDGRIVEANDAYARMTGHASTADLLGCEVDAVAPPGQVEATRAAFDAIFEGDADHLDLEHRYVRPDESVVHAHVTTSLVRDAHGHPLYTIALVEDVSERLRLEDQLREAQKMEALGRLAGGVAHDFNNVLTAIGGFGELISLGLSADHPLQSEAAEIGSATERAARLTRQLLTFSRRQVVSRQPVDVAEVVQALAPMLSSLLGDDVELTIDAARGATVLVDRNQLEQVLVNLVVNARDAMPRGGRLAIDTASVELDGDPARSRPGVEPGAYVALSVTDTGHGMDEETLRRVFEPFFTTKPPEMGTGLGLATVFGIVEGSGGTVTAYSQPDRGATFRVYLPRVERPAPEPARDRQPHQPAAPSATILLVDDDEDVRHIVQRLLELEGHRVLAAAGGDDGIALATEYEGQIDLLITDIVLPGLPGPRVAERIAGLQPGIGVLYSSGYPSEEIARRGVEPGAAFLEKPFTPDALKRAVGEQLAIAR